MVLLWIPGIEGQCMWGVKRLGGKKFLPVPQSQCSGTPLCARMTPAHPTNSRIQSLGTRVGLDPAAPGGSLETQNPGSAADLLSLQ